MITSRSNERVKAARALQDAKARRETGLHLIESEKLVTDAIASGARVRTVFTTEDAYAADGIETVVVSESVMEALATARTPSGLCAVVETPDCSIPETFPEGLIVVLDRLQDPGNVGTIIRTADALGAAGVLLSPDCADPFSPKALRAAMGSTYHLPVMIGALTEALPRLRSQGFTCVCGHLKGSETLPATGCSKVLVIGNEANGAPDEVADLCELYRLPMKGRAESLNAAIAAAILIYKLSE